MAVDAQTSGRDLLIACIDACGTSGSIWTEDLLLALARNLGCLDLDAAELARRLRPHGIASRQIFRRIDGKAINRRGYRLSDLRAALNSRRSPAQIARHERLDAPSGYVAIGVIPRGPHEPVAYFLEVGQRVKIGYTTNLYARLRAFGLRIENVVLLLEGGPKVERELHRMFARYRVGDTEWFSLAGDLGEYVNDARRRMDQPEIAAHVA
jgi:hypothetical protein